MKLRMKRSLALLLCLVLLCTAVPAFSARAEEIELIPVDEPEPVGEEEIVLIEEPAEPQTGEPTIAEQPASITKTIGYTAKFTVVAGGATKYQWYYRTSSSGSWHKSTLTGNQTATLSVTAKESRNGYQYRCRVSNARGYVYSKAATLTVTEKPVITSQPASVTKVEGTTAKFTVKASGATAYQWYYRTSSSGSWKKSTLSTATKATLSLTAKGFRDGYQYRCKVSNSRGCVYTKAVTLTVNRKPVILYEPVDVMVAGGQKATFRISASGADSYLWYYRRADREDWEEAPYTSKTSATLVTANLTYIMDGCEFRCKVSNQYGYVWTRIAMVTVTHNYPEITTQPTNRTINCGDAMQLSCKASGGGLSYQWYWRDSSADSWSKSTATGAKTATLSYDSVGDFMNGRQFRCLVSNDIGSVYTDAVTLTVKPVMPAITVQPANTTGYEGQTFRIGVKATGGYLKYQWYWRDSSADSWTESTATGAKTATLTYENVKSFMSGRQFRCKVYNDKGYVFSAAATLSFNPITCRALLIGQTYKGVTSAGIVQLAGDKSVQSMETVLGSVDGILGHTYSVTSLTDVSKAGWESAIRTTFAAADDNDVSLFYFFGHGNPTKQIFEETGAMVTVEGGGRTYEVLTSELAAWLDEVPGTVIVFLDCCGSGASILENGAVSAPDGAEAARFSELAVRAFAEREAAAPNVGELRRGKYIVLTSTTYDKPGVADWDGGKFTTALKNGVIGSMPADANGDSKVSLHELYLYVSGAVDERQSPCEYPADSSYVIFTKR